MYQVPPSIHRNRPSEPENDRTQTLTLRQTNSRNRLPDIRSWDSVSVTGRSHRGPHIFFISLKKTNYHISYDFRSNAYLQLRLITNYLPIFPSANFRFFFLHIFIRGDFFGTVSSPVRLSSVPSKNRQETNSFVKYLLVRRKVTMSGKCV